VTRPERGSATVLVLAAALVVGAVSAALAYGGALLLAGSRARTAADLAALAAADAAADGRPPCTSAAAVARANAARLVGCVPDAAGRVTVTVETRLPGPLRDHPVRARARAAPGEPLAGGVARSPPG
jgi:secretion/DNA translocation related TadE-like protein